MIYSLKGKVSHFEPNVAIIECNDIGFKCYVSDNTAKSLKIGENINLFTYMNVKDDGIDLYGFLTQEELKSFKLLITVSGVGPKVAISILSNFTSNSLANAISNGDYKLITKSPGIGQKTAQRIILELKGKICFDEKIDFKTNENNLFEITEKNKFQEALAALKSLGYMESEIIKTIKGYDKTMSVEEVIKKALKEL